MLTLHAWEPLIEDQQPDLSFALLTSLQRGLGYQEQEICDTGGAGGAASYHSSLTPGSLITLDVLSLHSSSSVL